MLTLLDIEIGEGLYPSDENQTYAEGPFKMVSPGRPGGVVAVDLMQSGTHVSLWDGGSGLEFSSEEFDVEGSEDGNTITFTAKDSEAGEYVITPVSYEELQEYFSYLNFSSEEEAVRVVKGLTRQVAGSAYGVYTGGKMTDLGLVIEDGADNVLGLYIINKDGTFRRENGSWVALDPDDDEANEELEEGLWIQALDGARDIFDEKENQDTLTLVDFEGYTL